MWCLLLIFRIIENKMVDFIPEKWLKRARITDFVILLCAILISVFVDGNGRVFGLSARLSNVIAVLVFGCGILLSSILTIADRKFRIVALLFLIIFLILVAPALLPL